MELINKVIEKVNTHTGIGYDHYLSKKRSRHIVEPKRMVIYLLRNFGLTSVRIGEILKLDHSTVLAHLKRHEDMILTDKNYRRTFMKIEAEL